MPIRAALFDLDGVVVFTDKYHYLGWKQLCDEEGYLFDEKVNDLCRGVPRMASLEVILRHNKVELSEETKIAFADRKNSYYVELLKKIGPDDLYPGVIAFLTKLRRQGVKIGLCSSSKNATLVLDSLRLTHFFDTIITGADIQNAKPHPEIFQLGAKRLGVKPDECLAFEDAPAGVDSALAAGMPCVGIGAAEFLPQATMTTERYETLDTEALFCAIHPSEWVLEEHAFDAKKVVAHGNKFLLGNGYVGCRGTLEEFGSDELVGLMVAGLYDKVGNSWREPVNAPNPFYTQVFHGQTPLFAGRQPIDTHAQSLNIRQGTHHRETRFALAGGNAATVRASRFLSLENLHLMAMEFEVRCDQAAELLIETGIDTRIWDINGPHICHWQQSQVGDVTVVSGITQEKGVRIAIAECLVLENGASAQTGESKGTIRQLRVPAGSIRFWKFAALYTDLDGVSDPCGEAAKACQAAAAAGFQELLGKHVAAWDGYWKEADVDIQGDYASRFALRYSLYHLLAIAPQHSERLSIPARGLSGQVYKGAVFWDTEMFMVPFFTGAMPEIARNLLLYRYHTLAGARRKAAEYGHEGAFFAWESQESGDDACSLFNVTDVFTGRPMRTYFRDKQIHISAAVAVAMKRYLEQTGDQSLLLEGGAEVIFECARFFRSYLYSKPRIGLFEFLDVTGPDEYHERVHNNAYTNRMARETFLVADAVRKQLEAEQPTFLKELETRLSLGELLDDLPSLVTKTYLPQPNEQGLIAQFDGYFTLEDVSLKELKTRLLNPTEYLGGGNGPATSTQIIKQADVVLMMSLFPGDFPEDIQRANWEFYEPRTEHGSSLSACAYGSVAARIGKVAAAFRFFEQTASIDLTGKSKQYIGPQYIGGTHPAANGGAWMVAVLGLAGLQWTPNGPSLNPHLPEHWKSITFRYHWRGQGFTVRIEGGKATVTADSTNTSAVEWNLRGAALPCSPGEKIEG